MDFMGNAQRRRSICNQDYVDFVKYAGCAPYIVCEGMDIEAVADDMDGLLLSGGKDISPLMYGEDLGWNGATKCNIVRDIFERDLYNAFIKRDKPVFGICRGFQLITLLCTKELRGKFEQNINKTHLKSVTQMHQQGEVDIPGETPVHLIECRGVLEKLVGKVLPVNSFHHQGFILAHSTSNMNGWIHQCEDIFAWARSREPARILEAFGMNVNETRVAGVQYHPERMLRRKKDRKKHVALFQYTMDMLDCDWEPSPPTTTPIPVATHPFAPRQQR
jgi:gamma-glutamyl-gamma-aminobutyrate hydrolase PuuD